MYIAIAGNIGSGKTYLTELLSQRLRWEAQYEESENPYIGDFYEDMRRWAFNLQVYFLGKRQRQIVHVDGMCNECGNCKSFCPYASAPYKDKFTLFASEADMADSTNDGFAVINPETKECKVRLLGQISDCKADDANDKLYEGLRRLICAVIDDYSYLITK